jgi:hypothetical protein
MDEAKEQPSVPRLATRRLVSGTRGLLASIVLIDLGLGWFAHECRRADRRTVLIGELARSFRVCSQLDEPTYLSQIVKKFWPRREAWLRGKIGRGWFDHPSIFVCDHLDDDLVTEVVRRLRELGTVQEVHYDGAGLTEAGIAELRESLPGVNVVPNSSPALHSYFLAATMGTHLAYGALGFMVVVALTALSLMVFSIRWLVRRFRVARLHRPAAAEPLVG